MRFFWFYIVCWKHRNLTRYEMFEQYTLVLKAARRCAYDLNHASASVFFATKDEKESDMYYERSKMWLEIFSPTGGKDYRHELHREIDNLEYEIKRLEKVCKENGINHIDPDAIPF